MYLFVKHGYCMCEVHVHVHLSKLPSPHCCIIALYYTMLYMYTSMYTTCK